MPGAIRTGLQRYVSDEELDRMRTGGRRRRGPAGRRQQQGAATSVLLAASPLVDGVSGKYFEDCNEAGPNQPGTRRGVAAHTPLTRRPRAGCGWSRSKRLARV